MTWVHGESGKQWVETPERKPRKSPRAVRFANIKVGDQVMRRWGNHPQSSTVWYYVVTDIWFDPVLGQDDPISGQMVAIQLIDPRTGEPRARKAPHTRRGLASQGFHYADIDYLAHLAAVKLALVDGAVVGIGKAHIIRRRPKVPGARF